MSSISLEWEDMKLEEGLKKEGRSDDFIAGARWSWEANQKAMKIYFSKDFSDEKRHG